MSEQLPNDPPRVRMTHPTLDGEITVNPLAVPHHQQAGWQVADGEDADYETWPAELQRFDGQNQVRMHHPDLDGDIIVAESAVPHHRSKGWLISDPGVAAQLESVQGLEAKTLEELKELARDRDLPVSGTKAELVDRLTAEPTNDTAGDLPAQDKED